MNVLIVSDVDLTGEGSGAERVLAAHCLGLAKRGHAVYLIAGIHGRGVKAVEEVRGVRVYRYRRSLSSCLASSRLFRALARQVPFDILMFYQPFSAFGVLLARGSRHLPKVYIFHSPWAEEYAVRMSDPQSHRLPSRFQNAAKFLRQRLERFVLGACQRIFVLSRAMAERLHAAHPGLNRQVAILPGGVDLDRFRPAENRRALKAALELPIGSPLLLTIRNLEPRMGLDHLLHAMKKVVQAEKDVALVIGGDGPMGQVLRELASRLGLNEFVRFEGYVMEERLPLLYQAADFFVLPSKDLEGFGLVAVEALACGTPVLGTPVGAIPEVLGGLEPGLLFEGADPDAIARGLREHLKRAQADPEGYEALRNRCRAYAGVRFGWDQIVEQLEQDLFQLARSLKRNAVMVG